MLDVWKPVPGSFRPVSSLVQSRAHNTHAVTVNIRALSQGRRWTPPDQDATARWCASGSCRKARCGSATTPALLATTQKPDWPRSF
eukprot:3483699-Prymnesium_polylepis.1